MQASQPIDSMQASQPLSFTRPFTEFLILPPAGKLQALQAFMYLMSAADAAGAVPKGNKIDEENLRLRAVKFGVYCRPETALRKPRRPRLLPLWCILSHMCAHAPRWTNCMGVCSLFLPKPGKNVQVHSLSIVGMQRQSTAKCRNPPSVNARTVATTRG